MHRTMPSGPNMLLWGAPAWQAADEPELAPGRRSQMLGLLALKSGEWVPRDRIAGLLWPEQGNAQARRNLRNVIFKAPAAPGMPAIQSNGHALRWDVSTDVQAFEQALVAGRSGDALDLRRGLLLEGLDDTRNDALAAWLAAERERLDARWHETALLRLSQLTDPDERAALAERLLRLDPLDEPAAAALIGAELARGRSAHARRYYRDFAARLAEDYGIEPSSRLRSLLDVQAPADRSAPAARPALVNTHVGAVTRTFVGRKAELDELARWLAAPEGRLITVLGPGGVGKSSMAQQAADRAAARCPGGVFWVELQDLRDVAAAAARLAQLVGASLVESRGAIAQIGAVLSPQPTLIVFDNAEHLTGLAGFIDDLLAAAPSLRVVATSRVRLRSATERVLVLAGLAVPDEDSRDLEAAQAFDAVRLFEARAGAVRRDFDLARHLSAVIRCVDAVAGLPLAIELSASWVRLLPPEEIANELQSSIDLLERDPTLPDAPARPEHNSMRKVLEGSWQMLSPAERGALAALSVFRGGFAAGAARAVAGVPITLIASLADKSLVHVADNGRFGLHPLVQAHAVAQLQADAEQAGRIGRRHAEHFAQHLSDLVRLHPVDPAPLADGIDAEHSNVLAAWHAAVQQDLPERVAAMAPALRTYFHTRGRMAEGVAQLSPGLALPQRSPSSTLALAQVQHAVASLHYHRHDLVQGVRVGEAGLASARLCRDRRLQFNCLSTLGACHSTAGRLPQAAALFERALAIARADGERAETARALADLGVIAKKKGSFDLALERYSQALAINRELGRHEAAARCTNNIGVVWMERRDWARARDVMGEGVTLCERHGLKSVLPYLQNGLGLALFELGEIDDAERQLELALQRSRTAELLRVELGCQSHLARVATHRGRHADAELRFRAAARIARQLGGVVIQIEIALYLAECQRDSGHRVEAARTWAMVSSHPNAEAGIRASAERWGEALALDAAERALRDSEPVSLEAVIDRLLASGD